MTNTAWYYAANREAQGKRNTFIKLITFYGDDLATEGNNDSKMRKYIPREAHIGIQYQP